MSARKAKPAAKKKAAKRKPAGKKPARKKAATKTKATPKKKNATPKKKKVAKKAKAGAKKAAARKKPASKRPAAKAPTAWKPRRRKPAKPVRTRLPVAVWDEAVGLGLFLRGGGGGDRGSVGRQIEVVNRYFRTGGRKRPDLAHVESGVEWENAIGRLSGDAFRIASVSVADEERPLLLRALDGFAATIFAERNAVERMRRYAVSWPDAGPFLRVDHRDAPSHIEDVCEHEGNRYFLRATVAGHGWSAKVLEYAPDGDFRELPDARMHERPRALRVSWGDRDELRTFIELCEELQASEWDTFVAKNLAKRASLSVSQAKLLLAGWPRAIDPWKRDWMDPDLRASLHLSVGDASQARDSLRWKDVLRTLEAPLRALEDPEELWDPRGGGPRDDGSVAAIMADAYRGRPLGRTPSAAHRRRAAPAEPRPAPKSSALDLPVSPRVAIEQVREVVSAATRFGHFETDWGAELTGCLEMVGDDADRSTWLHALWEPLPADDAGKLARRTKPRLSADYRDLLQRVNGVALFRLHLPPRKRPLELKKYEAFTLYGQPVGRKKRRHLPADLGALHGKHRPRDAPASWLCIGSYGEQWDRILLDTETGIVRRTTRRSAKDVKAEWRDVWRMLVTEAKRIAEAFDDAGNLRDGATI